MYSSFSVVVFVGSFFSYFWWLRFQNQHITFCLLSTKWTNKSLASHSHSPNPVYFLFFYLPNIIFLFTKYYFYIFKINYTNHLIIEEPNPKNRLSKSGIVSFYSPIEIKRSWTTFTLSGPCFGPIISALDNLAFFTYRFLMKVPMIGP